MMTTEPLVLGDVMRLVIEPDPAAGDPNDLVRDRFEMEIMNKLLQLPADADAVQMESGIAAGFDRLREKVGSPVAASAIDVHIISMLLMIRGSAPDGALYAGCRWRLVRRDRVDQQVFRREYVATAERFAQRTSH